MRLVVVGLVRRLARRLLGPAGRRRGGRRARGAPSAGGMLRDAVDRVGHAQSPAATALQLRVAARRPDAARLCASPSSRCCQQRRPRRTSAEHVAGDAGDDARAERVGERQPARCCSRRRREPEQAAPRLELADRACAARGWSDGAIELRLGDPSGQHQRGQLGRVGRAQPAGRPAAVGDVGDRALERERERRRRPRPSGASSRRVIRSRLTGKVASIAASECSSERAS